MCDAQYHVEMGIIELISLAVTRFGFMNHVIVLVHKDRCVQNEVVFLFEVSTLVSV